MWNTGAPAPLNNRAAQARPLQTTATPELCSLLRLMPHVDTESPICHRRSLKKSFSSALASLSPIPA